VCAGALQFEDAVELVAARGRLMQEAIAPGAGAMSAVLGLDLAELRAACAEAAQDETVECANLNAPGQIVISGSTAAVARAGELAKARGAKKVVPLAVSVPAHCALMAPAAHKYRAFIEKVSIETPAIPVIHNADIASHTSADSIRAALLAQLAQPVRWQETIELFATSGVTRALECGPGKVLGPLIKRCASGISTASLATPDELRNALGTVE
jgi:[acyl-carrier-protein] S-malonyltransferase